MGGIQVTEHARKLIVTVSTVWSFDNAIAKLNDLCLMKVGGYTIRAGLPGRGRAGTASGCEAPQKSGVQDELARAFAAAPGGPEFYSDGLKTTPLAAAER